MRSPTHSTGTPARSTFAIRISNDLRRVNEKTALTLASATPSPPCRRPPRLPLFAPLCPQLITSDKLETRTSTVVKAQFWFFRRGLLTVSEVVLPVAVLVEPM